MEKTKYIHLETVHNLESPQAIVPVIYHITEPESVVDVGCGIGTFLYCFKQLGVKRVLGLDGVWVDNNLRRKYLSDTEFKHADFEKSLDIGEKFDLAISLEVAEHLTEASAEHFVKNLTLLSDVIIFSAALPNQGGQNHLNEQTPDYWQKKFEKFGFEFHDILREALWNNTNIFWWYRQNIFLVTRKGHQFKKGFLPTNHKARTLIHPELFNYVASIADASTKKLSLIEAGGYGVKTYAKLLARALKRKFGLLGDDLPTIVFNPEDPLQK